MVSQDYKDIGHRFYEKFRIERDPEKKITLFQECCEAIRGCSIPEQVETIPVLVDRPPPSLLKMTAESAQDDAIEVQQQLMDAIHSFTNEHVLKGKKGVFAKAGKKGFPTYVTKLKSTDLILKDMEEYFQVLAGAHFRPISFAPALADAGSLLRQLGTPIRSGSLSMLLLLCTTSMRSSFSLQSNPPSSDDKQDDKNARSKEAIKAVTDILDVEVGLPAQWCAHCCLCVVP